MDRQPLTDRLGDRLLAEYGGAAAAYSLRALNGNGDSVVRVRRASDNAELGFTAAEITNGTLTAWAGAGDAFVKTWYDQSGNARDATQATAAAQPQIVASGSLVLDSNGKPTLSSDGVDDFLIVNNSRTITAQSVFLTAALDATATSNCRIFAQSSAIQDSTAVNLHIPALRKGITEQVSVFDGAFVINAAITYNTQFLDTILHSGSLISAFLNGASSGTSAQTLNFPITRQLLFCGAGSSNGTFEFWKGNLNELITYDNDQSANRTAIESNINGYYNIY